MQNKMLKKQRIASGNSVFINTKKRQGANEPPSETYQAAHSRPSILCRKTTGKDVRHLRPGWRISSPGIEPIIGGYRLDPQSTCKNKVRRPQQGLRTYDI